MVLNQLKPEVLSRGREAYIHMRVIQKRVQKRVQERVQKRCRIEFIYP